MPPTMTIYSKPEAGTSGFVPHKTEQSSFGFGPYMYQYEVVDSIKKLNDTVLGALIRASMPEFWAIYGDWGSFTFPSEEQLSVLQTSESQSRDKYVKYKILQKPLFDRLEYLREKVEKYPEDGDVIWPNDQACEDAKKFIRNLPLQEIYVPEIYFAHDGEVNFLWEVPELGLEVDLGFYGGGTYSFYATNNSGKKLKGDGVSIDEELPEDLTEILKF